MVDLAAHGVKVEEFRDLEGPTLDLAVGNVEDEEDEDVLLEFYWNQAAQGRALVLHEGLKDTLDDLGELVISPPFLVRAAGKKPSAILHLSSTGRGVNQRLLDELEAYKDGYSTVKNMATKIVQAFVGMVLTSGQYNIETVCGEELSLLVMGGDATFFRCATHEDIIGMQCARIRNITVVLLCCSFGWVLEGRQLATGSRCRGWKQLAADEKCKSW